MEAILKTIAKQANLDRILFTPSLKKMYFGMAVASGGATQFKHADNIRGGLSFAADKADDKKHILLFCAAYELVHCYDLLLKLSAEMVPVVVLATKSGTPEFGGENWNYLQLNGCGWIQFHTHTHQEVYDHLAMAYHLIEAYKVRVPILILHSCLNHNSQGEFVTREDIDLGNPLTGLRTSRAGKKKDAFAEALASLKQKKEKPTLTGIYATLADAIRQAYATFQYECPDEGFPLVGDMSTDSMIVSMIPADEETDQQRVCRLLCYRPFAPRTFIQPLQAKKKIAIVEPAPTPGATPVFYNEIVSLVDDRSKKKIVSATYPVTQTTLSSSDLDDIAERW